MTQLAPPRASQGKGHSRTQSNQRLLPSHTAEEGSGGSGGADSDGADDDAIRPLPTPIKPKISSATAKAMLPQIRLPSTKKKKGCSCGITRFLDRHLAGRSDSSEYSDSWKRKFSRHPSYCDADMCLQQIRLGNAHGNRMALYARSFFQRMLFSLGSFVQEWPKLVLAVGIFLMIACSFGLRNVEIETDLLKLWVSEGGRLNEELSYFSTLQSQVRNTTRLSHSENEAYDNKHFILEPPDEKLQQIPEDESTASGYQVLIQTVDSQTKNILTKEGLLRHVRLMEEIVGLKVQALGMDWSLSDICFKPGKLDIDKNSIAYVMKPTLERLVPCIWITPIDCYWEGSKPIGPTPPIQTSEIPMGALLKMAVDLPDSASWSNLNPAEILTELHKSFDLGTVIDFFSRTGIGNGYMDRPCINPLDPDCPKSAPNYYHTACDALQLLKEHLHKEGGKTLAEELATFGKPSDGNEGGGGKDTSVFDIFGALLSPSSSAADGKNNSTGGMADDEKEKDCLQYRRSFLRWVEANQEKESAHHLLQNNTPTYPNFAAQMRHGCNGLARDVLNWPLDMIVGGIHRSNSEVESAEALQSVLLVASPTDVYRRFKSSASITNASLLAEWSPLAAKEVIAKWQRAFANSIYSHELNFKGPAGEERIIHPLASSSISDLLSEFANFNYGIIGIGYTLMLFYAVYSQVKWDGCCLLSVNSSTGLAFFGVLTVTLASVAGLGTSTWMNIHFNAATTNIVPFLTLGIGVDNMFLLLHSWPHVTAHTKKDEIGVLMRETGMSILMTSVNNILSFLTGTILPIPALRSFCAQSSILLAFNLLAILTLYPAIIALDLKRRKRGLRDGCCCCASDESMECNPAYDSPYGFDLSTPALTPAQELLSKGEPALQYHGLFSVAKGDDFEEEDEVGWGWRSK